MLYHNRNTRSILLWFLMLTLMLSVSSHHLTMAQNNERCFAETGYCINGRLLAFWEQNDGLRVFGLPISPQQTEAIEGQPLEVQWFERNRLELHPEQAPPYDVLLGRLGVDCLQQQGRDWFAFPKAPAEPSCLFFEATGQSICGEFLRSWQANGLEQDGAPGSSFAESLALFGQPISPPQTEQLEDGREYTVQWFERARFEYHPEQSPPFDVLFGLLGHAIYQNQCQLPPAGQLAFVSSRDGNNEIYTMNADGSNPTRLTRHPRDDRYPAWSSDGSQLVFTRLTDDLHWTLRRINADGSDERPLITTATVTPTVSDVTPAWSPDGTRLAISSWIDDDWEIVTISADGSDRIRLTKSAERDDFPDWSPDGQMILFESFRDGNWEIYQMNADGSNLVNLTNHPADDLQPVWSADGSQIAFASNRNGNHDIYTMNADTHNLVNLTNHPADDRHPSWSPDGSQLAFTSDRDDNYEIYTMRPDGSNLQRLTNHPAIDTTPHWSP